MSTRPANGTKVKINMGDSVHQWIVVGIVSGFDRDTDELIVTTQEGPVCVAWPEGEDGMTVLDADGWNREVCLRRIAERTTDRQQWQNLFDQIENLPADYRSNLYGAFIRNIVESPEG